MEELLALFVWGIDVAVGLVSSALWVMLYWRMHRIGKRFIAEGLWWMTLIPMSAGPVIIAFESVPGSYAQVAALAFFGFCMAGLLTVRAKRPTAVVS